MPVERSAGVVIFKNALDGRKYLILHSRRSPGSKRPDFWDFPKGLLEKGETGLEAAKREVKEETGLEIKNVLPDFKETASYFTKWSGKTIPKFAAMFLAEMEAPVTLSIEHDRYEWLSYEDARKRLTNSAMKKLLQKADEFLSRRKKLLLRREGVES